MGKNDKNILLVGGCGYLGGALTDILKNSSYNVKVYDNLVYEETYRKNIDFVYGDIRDRDKLKKHLDWSDTVIWLAALVGDGACSINPILAEEINTESVKWLSENFNGKIVHLSTCSTYGMKEGILDENSETNPLSIYAITKLKSEQYLKGKNAIIFRLGTLFGVGDLFSRIRLDLVVNVLVVNAVKTNSITLFGGNQYRPLLHVKDVANMIYQVLDDKYANKRGIYNLHYKNMKIIDLADVFKKHFPDLIVNKTEMSFQDLRNYRVSSDKAIKELDFNPTYTIDYGIKQIKELIIDSRIKNTNNNRYNNYQYLIEKMI